MSLRDHLERVRSGLQTFEDYGLSEQIDFSAEIRPGAQAVLKAAVKLIDTSELYIREYLIEEGSVQQLSYAYQHQAPDGTLIFRYDNAAHRPPLGFDHHKHDTDGSIIPAEPPSIEGLVQEIIDYVTR
ncbi:hypothetical protein IQ254_25900 [Nodosilinea sp. LEGE 07088]|uniref:toxin-antitoxin system TumE family protein n=1 Tax=Nodosilinea sp. LEGE 07088 TaxID=2777968 RepID=UPI0018827889|nr:DUF6516 family protein [Nodosilinea sp. LEGE 07088]MBE9140593.1 hypothetical protein [Nodosilinea sp. LEGE 07088]